MRLKTVIPLAASGLLAGGLFLLWAPASGPKVVTLTFNGYSADGSKAVFGITNRTEHFMDGGRPRLEYLTVDGWTNYYDEEDLIPAHAPGLHAGDGWSDERHLPPGHDSWRAHVSYRLYAEREPSTALSRLRGQARWLLGLDSPPAKRVPDKLQVVYTQRRNR